MKKITIWLILSLFTASNFLVAYGQQNGMEDKPSNGLNQTSQENPIEQVISYYEKGIKFRDVIPIALGILAFSYFIWKTAKILSTREVFVIKQKYSDEGKQVSLRRKRISYVANYVVFFPIILYGWIVICFFFMYALNTSLGFDALTLIMVGIITATRIAAHWNEKLAEDIMKFLPFNLLFTLLFNPVLDLQTIISKAEKFPLIMLELTIFIGFIGLLEGILKLIYFIVTKNRRTSNDLNSPIAKK
ncbi:MAG TPA: hypothetical protein VLD38_06880 [Nitrosopumilaceae archaeon]|nr:hypothetical protein [Nitrosopumilaceae archaeon]